jgi:hypothetical protein
MDKLDSCVCAVLRENRVPVLTDTEVVVEPVNFARDEFLRQESTVSEDPSNVLLLSSLGWERRRLVTAALSAMASRIPHIGRKKRQSSSSAGFHQNSHGVFSDSVLIAISREVAWGDGTVDQVSDLGVEGDTLQESQPGTFIEMKQLTESGLAVVGVAMMTVMLLKMEWKKGCV